MFFSIFDNVAVGTQGHKFVLLVLGQIRKETVKQKYLNAWETYFINLAKEDNWLENERWTNILNSQLLTIDFIGLGLQQFL